MTYVFMFKFPWESDSDDMRRYDFKVTKEVAEIRKIKYLYVAGIKVAIKEKIKLYTDGRCEVI